MSIPIEERRSTISFTIKPIMLAIIDDIARYEGTTRSRTIENLVVLGMNGIKKEGIE